MDARLAFELLDARLASELSASFAFEACDSALFQFFSASYTEQDFLMLCVVRYPSDPLLQHHHFGCEGGMDLNVRFCLHKEVAVFTKCSEERKAKLSRGSALTLRELISDGKLESADRSFMRKPVFLFGDSISAEDSSLLDGNYKWLR